MDQMENTSEKVHAWLNERDHKIQICYAYDLACKNQHITNNMTDSFNSYLCDLRSFTPIKMTDILRKQLMIGFIRDGIRVKTCKKGSREIVG